MEVYFNPPSADTADQGCVYSGELKIQPVLNNYETISLKLLGVTPEKRTGPHIGEIEGLDKNLSTAIHEELELSGEGNYLTNLVKDKQLKLLTADQMEGKLIMFPETNSSIPVLHPQWAGILNTTKV